MNSDKTLPKTIHYCWFGRNPLPELAKKCINSWKKFLPDYQIKEWNEDNFDVNMSAYTKEAYRLKKYAFVSDYARIWILYHYGGIYFDTDVEVIAPMDNIISAGPFLGREKGEDGFDSNIAFGLGMSAFPKMSFLGELLDIYNHRHFAYWSGKNPETIVNFVSHIINSDKKNIEHLESGIDKYRDFFIHPSQVFCPMSYYTGETHITPDTISVHHYTSLWVSMEDNFVEKFKRHLSIFTARLLTTLGL
ncbi:MAG: glycosyltransferase [Bacteroidales bacterium]|nr:glycosyltransferase [Bacteroidales bacterium]